MLKIISPNWFVKIAIALWIILVYSAYYYNEIKTLLPFA